MRWRHIVTDFDNATVDTGRVLAAFVVVSGVLLAAYDVVVHAAHFDMQAYGVGIGGILTGLGLYLFGDGKAKREDAASPPPLR